MTPKRSGRSGWKQLRGRRKLKRNLNKTSRKEGRC